MPSLNRFSIVKIAALAGAAFVSSIVGRANVIDFDTGGFGNDVGNFYAGQGVSFLNTHFTGNFALLGSSGEVGVIATLNGGYANQYEWDQAHAVVALFAGGASGVGITGLDVGTSGIRIDAYDSLVGGNLIGFDQAFGPGAGGGFYVNIFTGAAAIMRVEIYQLFPGRGEGIILDNLVFSPSAVPDTGSTAILMIGALVSVAALRRKAV